VNCFSAGDEQKSVCHLIEKDEVALFFFAKIRYFWPL